MEKHWKRWKHSRTWTASSMSIEDLMKIWRQRLGEQGQYSYVWGIPTTQEKLPANTKVKISNFPFYGGETWRTTTIIIRKVLVFLNTCLRNILRVCWPNIISNNLLWQREKQDLSRRRNGDKTLEVDRPQSTELIKMHRIVSQTYDFQGQRKMGRSKNNLPWNLLAGIKRMNGTWKHLVRKG